MNQGANIMCKHKNRFVLLNVAIVLLTATAACPAAESPKTELLWPKGAPGTRASGRKTSRRLRSVCRIQALPPAPRWSSAPGGGYGGLAVDHEGRQVAAWLNSIGVAAFILEYRHHGRGYQHPAPLDDAQRAIRTVRARATEWKVDPKRIGILGFSAGGHLASTAGTHFDRGDPAAEDLISPVSCRPDFLILCYAVIAFDEPYTHRGSQANLLGKNAPAALVRSLSNEKQVTKETPPTFLFHTDEDSGVPAENSIYFYLALRKAGMPAELHIFRPGQHGLGLAPHTPGTSAWPKCCEGWLRSQGFLTKTK